MTARFDIDNLDPNEQRRRRKALAWEEVFKTAACSPLQSLHAALAAQAARTARAMIKVRARGYLAEPHHLAALGDDLPSLPPVHLVTALAYIARNLPTYRWFGNGGEVPAVNLRAAMLCARFRRFHRIKARRAA